METENKIVISIIIICQMLHIAAIKDVKNKQNQHEEGWMISMCIAAVKKKTEYSSTTNTKKYRMKQKRKRKFSGF